MQSERTASEARPPALRITCASLREKASSAWAKTEILAAASKAQPNALLDFTRGTTMNEQKSSSAQQREG